MNPSKTLNLAATAAAQTWHGVETMERRKQRQWEDRINNTVGEKTWIGGSSSGSDGGGKIAAAVVALNWLGLAAASDTAATAVTRQKQQ